MTFDDNCISAGKNPHIQSQCGVLLQCRTHFLNNGLIGTDPLVQYVGLYRNQSSSKEKNPPLSNDWLSNLLRDE